MKSILTRSALLLLSLLFLAVFLLPASRCAAAEAGEETTVPEAETDTPADGGSTQAEAPVAKGYILLSFSGGSFWLPLPESEDYTLPIRQTREDGTEELNLIHVTPEGFYMESSTCENQDCVEQGIVTLENRNQRILYNAVLCLPNMVSLALYTPEEILEMYAPAAGASGEKSSPSTENNP